MQMLRLGLPALCSATALALGAAVASTPGCTDASSNATDHGARTFEAGATSAASSSACTTCGAQECTGAWALCLTDRRCAALRGCATPFSESSAGRQACFCDGARADATAGDDAGRPDPLALYAAYASCNDARTCAACASDCASSCAGGAFTTTASSCGDAGTVGDAATSKDAGDASDAAEEVTAATCASCVANRCGDAKKACALGSECSLFLVCAKGCTDATCVEACGVAHATGKASAKELSSCTLTSCRSACGL